MADPTNRNDATYASDPNYVWSNDRWQYRGGPEKAPIPGQEHTRITAEGVGTPGGMADVFGSLADRIGGTPFGGGSSGGQNTGALGAPIANIGAWRQLAEANANRQTATNPYQTAIADRARQSQLALMAQMQQMQSGPSLAAMQGQRALGQMGQAALGSGNARAAMLGTQGAGASIAGDVGQGRLGEIMRSRAGMGGVAGALRGSDLRSAEQAQDSGLQAQGISDQRSRFYAGLGSDAANAQARAALESYKLNERLKQAGRQQNQSNIEGYLSMLASLYGAGAGK